MPVEHLLQIMQANAGGFVIMGLLALAFGWALWHTNRARINDLDVRLKACEGRHGDCEDRNREQAMAILDLLSGNEADARSRLKKLLDE